MNTVIRSFLIALLAYVAPAAGSTIPFFQVTQISRPTGCCSDTPTGINEDGAVVGTMGAFHRGFLWTATGGLQDLAVLAGLGSGSFMASAINDSGRIAGGARVDPLFLSDTQPVLWDTARGFVVLTPPGSQLRGVALDVSNTNLAAGWTAVGVGTPQAFVWDAVNGLRDLNTLAGVSNFTAANAINDSGQVAGESIVNGNSHAVIWDPLNGLLDLTALSGIFGNASDINNHGAVVGGTDFGDSGDVVVHAFLYQDGLMTDLGSLGRPRSFAFAVNDAGQVVGQAGTSQGIPLGWYYDGDQMWNLNRLIDQSLGWTIVSANDINNGGQIVATARRLDDPFFREYAVLLDPISGPPLAEPGTLALLGLGLLGLGATRRRTN